MSPLTFGGDPAKRTPAELAKRLDKIEKQLKEPIKPDRLDKSALLRMLQSELETESFVPGAIANPSLSDGVQAALAQPVLRAHAGGTMLAGTTASSRLCNQDSTPKVPSTLVNQNIYFVRWEDTWDAPPEGYKTEFAVIGHASRNAGNVASRIRLGLWPLNSFGGGAGGYVETMVPAFVVPYVDLDMTAGQSNQQGWTGWQNDEYLMRSTPDTVLGMAVNNTATIGANSAVRFNFALYRRWVPL